MSKKKIKINIDVSRGDILNKFNINDFAIFKKKFCGVFIYRGKRSYSIKLYDYFLKELKLKFKKNPISIFFKIIKNVMPFFLIGQKKRGKRIIYVPVIAKINRKHRYILNWLVRQLKGRSNVIGVKKEDVLNLLIESFKKKGSAINLKKDFFNQAMAYRFNMRRRSSDKKIINEWKKKDNKQKQKDKERMFLLTFLTMNDLERYLELKNEKFKEYFFFKTLKKKRYSYKNYFVK